MRDNAPVLLAMDTSNYTTSLAVIEKSGHILLDRRLVLKVRQGERGLRQSDALFQHMQNLPELLGDCFYAFPGIEIAAIAVSDKPRPQEESYMPVFSAGLNFGRALAASLRVPLFRFSHQEGHIAAGAYGTGILWEEPFLAFHLSGGTTELLSVKEGSVTLLGGTRDISFGQVIDRIGVLAGLSFPAGKEMDKLAKEGFPSGDSHLKPVYFQGLDLNLSGLETQVEKWFCKEGPSLSTVCYELFQIIAQALVAWSVSAMDKTGCSKILFTGGVASSSFIRNAVTKQFMEIKGDIIFGDSVLSSDNAVGIGLLGAGKLWQ